MFQWENKAEIEAPEFIGICKGIEELGKVSFAKWEQKYAQGWRVWTRDSKVWEYPFVYRWLNRLKVSLGIEKMKVMDFGCGTTPFAAFLNKQGFDVWAADNQFLGYPGVSRKEDLEKEYPEVHYYLGDVLAMQENDFDAIVSCSVLEHVVPATFRIDILKGLRKLLKPEGKMLHVVDYYFPEKRRRDHQRINFSELGSELGFSVSDQSMCPGHTSFDFSIVRNKIDFIRPKALEARIAIGDD